MFPGVAKPTTVVYLNSLLNSEKTTVIIREGHMWRVFRLVQPFWICKEIGKEGKS